MKKKNENVLKGPFWPLCHLLNFILIYILPRRQQKFEKFSQLVLTLLKLNSLNVVNNLFLQFWPWIFLSLSSWKRKQISYWPTKLFFILSFEHLKKSSEILVKTGFVVPFQGGSELKKVNIYRISHYNGRSLLRLQFIE